MGNDIASRFEKLFAQNARQYAEAAERKANSNGKSGLSGARLGMEGLIFPGRSFSGVNFSQPAQYNAGSFFRAGGRFFPTDSVLW